MLRCRVIGIAGHAHLFPEHDKISLQGIRIGGCVVLLPQQTNNGGAYINPWEQSIVLNVILGSNGKEQCQSEKCNSCQKVPQRFMLLDSGQNFRRNIQLRQVVQHLQSCRQDAEQEHPPAGIPGNFCHPPDILNDIILRFRFFFHVASPRNRTLS